MGWRKFRAVSLVLLILGLVVLHGAGQSRRQAKIEVRPTNPTEDDSITLVLSGKWPNSCTPESPRVRAIGNRVMVETSNPSDVCLQTITPWELEVPIGELSADTYRVIITFEGEMIGQGRFEVEESEPELVDLEVEPSSLGLGVGEQKQLTSWAIYHHNGLGEKKDVTDEARWRSSDTSVAVVSKGLVSGKGPGEARINAIYEGERDSAVVAVKAEEYLLTVDIQGEGKVRNGGIDCPPDCSEAYPAGSRLSLTAEAPPGWEFNQWKGCDLGTHAGECGLKMDEDKKVLAIFEEKSDIGEAKVEIIPPSPTTEDPITIEVFGTWPNSCVPNYEDYQVDEDKETIEIDTINESEACLTALTDYRFEVEVGALPAGEYSVTVSYRSPPQDLDEQIIGSERFEIIKESGECVLKVTSKQGGTTEPELDDHTHPCGEMVEVEAIPAESWEFTGWELTGSVADQFPPFPDDNPITFELRKDSEFDYDAGLFAHFAQVEEPKPPSAREVNVEILPKDAEPGEPATVHVYGTWENGCIPRYDDLEVDFYGPGIMINTINESEHCTMALMNFDLKADVKELPTAFHVDVYYEDISQDTLELIASEWFSQ
ncbi:MAG: hypothetical protein V5A77_07075 [Candidatus Bipolaricaulota bacterium]|nr:hypothetical protein [Candidatus Bipolaricaulota bacterium]MBS3792010.1 hypothetical protein [Candidatus Bipolaricaulota bacterium]